MRKLPKHKYTSFYLTSDDDKMIHYLATMYGCGKSMVIRKLITEKYAILKYIKQDAKGGKK